MICDDGGRGKWKIANQKATFFYIWNFQTKILLISPAKSFIYPNLATKPMYKVLKRGEKNHFLRNINPWGKSNNILLDPTHKKYIIQGCQAG